MGGMCDTECLECGESAENTHPEYPGDVLCDDCFAGYCEEQVEYWVKELGALKSRGYLGSITNVWNLEDY